MAIAKYNAYEGTAEMPNGITVRVAHLAAPDVKAIWGKQSRINPARKRPGWYWNDVDRDASKAVGPYTSSKRAMDAAVRANGMTLAIHGASYQGVPVREVADDIENTNRMMRSTPFAKKGGVRKP
jgi:hypothetical protein